MCAGGRQGVVEDSHTFVGKSEGELKGWDSKDPLVNIKSQAALPLK